MIGNAQRSGQVLAAGRRVGEAGGEQIVGAHALQLRRDLLAAAHAQNGQRPRRVPAPTRAEHRRGQERLRQRLFGAGRLDVFEDDLERKGMLLGEREHDAVVGRRRLQLDVERATELLAQREAPRAIDPRAERRVQDQLHTAAFVEETLGDDGRVGGHDAENRLACAHVGYGLVRARVIDAAEGDEPFARRDVVAFVDGPAEFADLVREFDGAPRPFAAPKWNRGRRAARVLDAHGAARHAPDHPRRRAQQENVAGLTLDGEVFVDGADRLAVGLRDHVVVGRLGNGAARGDCRHPCAAARAQPAVDAIVVQKRAEAAARGRDAVGEHGHDFVEGAALEIAIGVRPANERVQLFDVPLVARTGRDELLRQHVERRGRNAQRVDGAAAHRPDERRAFQQLIAGRGEEPAFGQRAHPVSRAADALEGNGDRARRAELDDEIDRADIDAEFERGRRDHAAQRAFLETVFGVEANLAREAAVVGQHDAFAEPGAQRKRDAFAHAARRDEDERRLVRENQCGHAIVDLGPHLGARDGAEFAAGHLDRERHGAPRTDIDDPGIRAQECRHFLQRTHGGRQTDALRLRIAAPRDQVVEPCQGQHEVRAAFVGRDGVNLVDHDRLDARQQRARSLRGEHDEERLRRRDQDVRRLAQHARALGRRGVAGARSRADGREVDAALAGQREHFGKRRLEILANVVGQRLERRHVDDDRGVRKGPFRGAPHEPVERQGKGRERLARPRRSGDQDVAPGSDQRPAVHLRLGRLAIATRKPLGNERTQQPLHRRPKTPIEVISVAAPWPPFG